MNEMTDDAVFERAAKLLDGLQTEKVSAYDTARILSVALLVCVQATLGELWKQWRRSFKRLLLSLL